MSEQLLHQTLLNKDKSSKPIKPSGLQSFFVSLCKDFDYACGAQQKDSAYLVKAANPNNNLFDKNIPKIFSSEESFKRHDVINENKFQTAQSQLVESDIKINEANSTPESHNSKNRESLSDFGLKHQRSIENVSHNQVDEVNKIAETQEEDKFNNELAFNLNSRQDENRHNNKYDSIHNALIANRFLV